MRIFHTAYRTKNPARRVGLRGAKKQVHADLVRILNPSRKDNPAKFIKGRPGSKGLGKSIDAVNFLAELNKKINELAASEGFDKKTRKANRKLAMALMPLRDTVEASVKGYLEGDALEYSLEAAMRDLTTAEVAAIQRLYKEKRAEEKKSLAEGRRSLTSGEILDIQRTLEKRTLTAADARLAQQAIVKQRPSRGAPRRSLTAPEVRAVQHALDVKRRRAKSEAKRRETRESELRRFEREGKSIRRRAKLDPAVIAAQERVSKAKNISKLNAAMFKAAFEHGTLGSREWQRGPTRHAEMKASLAATAKEIGKEPYKPKDEELWDRVVKALEKKYPYGYVPPKLDHLKKDDGPAGEKNEKNRELKLLIELSHVNTSATRKKEIRERLETPIRYRFRTKTILAYEKLGGRQKTRSEIAADKKDRKEQKFEELGKAFKVGSDHYGQIQKGKGGYIWGLIDADGNIKVSGISTATNSASKQISKAYDVTKRLRLLGDKAGWDNLPEPDRRWFEKNRPRISKATARLLVKNIGKRKKLKITTETLLWLQSAGGLKKREDIAMAKGCKNMGIGEERVFKGKANAYSIHVKMGIHNKYTMWVVTKDGRKSRKYPLTGCNKAIAQGHAVAGSMIGAGKVAKAVSNPAKIKRLDNDARKFFRKKNPEMPRGEAEAASIKDLAGMFTIPEDSEEAFRYGFYFGIIRGIDTCGVQNFFKRRKIRKRYQERALEGLVSEASRAAGIDTPTPKRRQKPEKLRIRSALDRIFAADEDEIEGGAFAGQDPDEDED